MTEPQVWVFMGLFSTIILAVIGMQSGFLTRVIRLETASIRTEMSLRFENVDRRFEQVDRRFEQIDQRFEQVERRFDEVGQRIDRMTMQIDGLDRDVRYLMHRELGDTDLGENDI